MENRLTYGYYMVNIWLMMVNNNLVGGAITILKKYEFVNGKDDIPYIMENNPNVPNHQPVMDVNDNRWIIDDNGCLLFDDNR